ncbi:MAG: ornithine cyclodeaminase family protein [Acidipropionibacterium sp.]|jgi:ornithine cyclodeaminase|nr:ornithine cyclodeaminase family protein [Acidipropionibacterium sp.]
MTALRRLDADAVTAALSPAAAVDAIAGALTGGFDPARDIARTIAETSQGQFLLMPAEVGDAAGVKVATVAPANPAVGLPRIQASYLFFDARTLTLRATLDGTALTTLRTPAVSVAAIRPALERFDGPLRVAVFGAGPQGIGHVQTLAAIAPGPLAGTTFIVRHPDKAVLEARELGEVVDAGSPEARQALSGAQVVVCATSARTPLFDADAVASNAVVIAVGSHEPDARELPGALLARSTVIVEDRGTAVREAGDIVLALGDGVITEDDLIPMRDAVTGVAAIPADRPVVFKSVGMSWQDLVVADAVLRAADRRA